MKKQTFLRSMIAIIAICFIATTGCKKDELEEIQQKRIDEVIPQKYIDTLKQLGITINEGTTPPNMEGIYQISSAKLEASNISTDIIGTVYTAMKFKLFSQNNTDFSIQLYGKNFIGLIDTSIVTAVSGNGNNFTVYGKIKANNGLNYAIFGLIISGTKEGADLKDVKFSLINIDNSNGGGFFIPEGKARLFYDADFISESISVFRLGVADDKRKTAGQR